MSQEELKRIPIDWDEYARLAWVLCEKIMASDFEVKQVICIARGGALVGELVSRALRVPLAYHTMATYPDDATAQGSSMEVSRNLAHAKPLVREGVLIVDDLTETGTTFNTIITWLVHWEGIPREQIRTALLWHKQAVSGHEPDFYAELLQDEQPPWIDQPQELFAARFRVDHDLADEEEG